MGCMFRDCTAATSIIEKNGVPSADMLLSHCFFDRNVGTTDLKTGAGNVRYGALVANFSPVTFVGGVNTNLGFVP